MQYYKITKKEKKEAIELLTKHVPRAPLKDCYEEYIQLFMDLEQTQILCKYFGCNIEKLAGELKTYKEARTGVSEYAGPKEKRKLIIKQDQFKSEIGNGLEKDVYFYDFGERKYAIAYAINRRIKKVTSELFRIELEKLTGKRWRIDEVSKYIYHMIIDEEEDVHKNNR